MSTGESETAKSAADKAEAKEIREGGADKNLDFHRAPKGAFYVFKTAEN